MDKTKLIGQSIIATAIILVGYFFSSAWENTHYSYRTAAVTGLGKQDFTSDLIVWRTSFTRSAYSLQDANRLIKDDIKTVKKFLKENGISENEAAYSSLKINRNYKQLYNESGKYTGETFDGYTLFQEVIIESKKLTPVENAIIKVGDLIEKGIEFSAEEPDYYYTKLSDLKLELLKNATEDALKRAQTITQNAQSNIKALKGAEMGVFQITGQNSNEDYSWGGSFNTKAKRKTASVTVKLTFGL
jgi:hypothetical protein